MKKLLLFWLIAIGLTFAVNKASAASFYWTGNSSSAWNSASNWYNATPFSFATIPGAGDDVYIGVNTFAFIPVFTGPFQPTISSATQCASLRMSDNQLVNLTLNSTLAVTNGIIVNGNTSITTTAGTPLLTGASLTVGSTSVLSLNVPLTSTGTVAIGANCTLTNTSTGIINAASLTLASASTLNIAGNATFTGAVTVNGSSTVAGAATLSAASLGLTGSYTLTDNANVNISGSTTVSNTFSSTINIGSGFTYTATGGITIGSFSTSKLTLSGSGNASVSGTTTVNIGSTLAVTGAAVTYNAGSTINMNNNNTVLSISSGSINFAGTSASRCTLSTGGTNTITNAGTFNGTYLTITNNGNSAPITNSGTFTVSNAIWNPSQSSSFTNSGQATFTSSSMTLANNSASFSSTAGTLTLTGCTVNQTAGTATLSNSGTGNFVINGGSTVTLGSSNTGSISGAGTGTFTINGASTINLNGATSQITNSGTMYAGTSGSACTINIGAQPANQTTGANIYNSGTFSLASTSIIKFGASYQQCINNVGTFTLKSDANGSASIGALTSGQQQLIIGTYVVERYFTGGSLTNRGWRLMSSPVNNTSTLPLAANATTATTAKYSFSSLKTNLLITGTGGSAAGFDQPASYTANGPTILFYNTSTSLFTWPSAPSNTVAVGSGFYFFFRGNNTSNLTNKVIKSGTYAVPEANVVGLLSGTMNQQDFRYTLSNAGTGFNMVGNPYPSTISMSSSPLTGTTGFIYTYNSNGNSITTQPSAINIASGQGFFVKSNAATSYITFSESLKVATQLTGTNLLMGTPVSTEEPLISLKMIQDSANFDIAHLRFLDSYKPGYDEMEDAEDLNGQGQTVFFGAMTSDSHKVAIASQPIDKKLTSVYLSVNDNTSGLYSIQKLNLSGIPAKYDVWLMDHFTRDSLDLRANSTYNFNLDKTNSATYGNNRLEVVIRKKVLPPYKLLSFTGKKTGNDALLDWNTANEFDYTSFELQKSTDGKIFDAVHNSQSDSKGVYTYKDLLAIVANTDVYYRLKAIDINDQVYYSDVVIISGKGNGSFSVYPNPATSTLQFTLNQPVTKSIKMNIYNSMGVLVKSSSFSSSTGQQDVSSFAIGTYTLEIIDSGSRKPVLTGKFTKL